MEINPYLNIVYYFKRLNIDWNKTVANMNWRMNDIIIHKMRGNYEQDIIDFWARWFFFLAF